MEFLGIWVSITLFLKMVQQRETDVWSFMQILVSLRMKMYLLLIVSVELHAILD